MGWEESKRAASKWDSCDLILDSEIWISMHQMLETHVLHAFLSGLNIERNSCSRLKKSTLIRSNSSVARPFKSVETCSLSHFYLRQRVHRVASEKASYKLRLSLFQCSSRRFRFISRRRCIKSGAARSVFRIHLRSRLNMVWTLQSYLNHVAKRIGLDLHQELRSQIDPCLCSSPNNRIPAMLNWDPCHSFQIAAV